MASIAQLKQKFDKALTYINRPGVDELVEWLKNDTDFFSAPASTLFHGNYEGGLLEHSIHVTELSLVNFNFMVKYKPDLEHLRESVVISGLFHDVCKINCYKWGEKGFTKSESGKWLTYEKYKYEDDLPIGHGEKSVYYISKFMELTKPELMAIRWHMGATEVGTQINGLTKYSYNSASEHPLVRLIHAADLTSVTLADAIDYKSTAS